MPTSDAFRSSASFAGGALPPRHAGDVRALLVAAANRVMRLDAQAAASNAAKRVEASIAKLMPIVAAKGPDDPCSDLEDGTSREIAPICVARQQAMDEADLINTAAVEDAAATLDSARRTWTMALGNYDFAIKTAAGELQEVVAQAVAAYRLRIDENASGREPLLRHTMKQSIARAAIAHDGAVQAAGAALSAETGTLIAAGQAYIAAVGVAASTAAEARAAAMANFWQCAEGVIATSPASSGAPPTVAR